MMMGSPAITPCGPDGEAPGARKLPLAKAGLLLDGAAGSTPDVYDRSGTALPAAEWRPKEGSCSADAGIPGLDVA